MGYMHPVTNWDNILDKPSSYPPTSTTGYLTYMNGWITNGHLPILTKVGKVVSFSGILRKGTNTTGTIIAVVPVGYRPSAPLNIIATTANGNAICSLNINGNIELLSVLPNIDNVQFTASWTI